MPSLDPEREVLHEPGADLCLLEGDLIGLAQSIALDGADLPASDPRRQHLEACTHCQPRFDALLRLYRSEPAPQPLDTAALPGPATWTGTLAPVAGNVLSTTLAPVEAAAAPLLVRLHLDARPGGGATLRVVLPVTAGVTAETLDALNGHWFIVELNADDPDLGWGFDTVLQWDAQRTALVAARTVPLAEALPDDSTLTLTALEPT